MVHVSRVQTGLDVLIAEAFAPLRSKRVGLITNPTGRTHEGRFIADVLMETRKVELVALFGPEHGVRGDAPDGLHVASGTDPKTGLPVWSLYGETRKPTREMIGGLDVLIYDIQDVGARFYTFISTLSLCAEAAFEAGIEFMVLDRPNPITGTKVEGNLLDRAFSSFVGLHPIPIRHGLTVGELAALFMGEGWLKNRIQGSLHVLQMEGWKRVLWFDETGLSWVPPSPNMPSLSTATVYPGMCLIEGTNVSEGRGTAHPFEIIGAPWINGEQLASLLNRRNLPGVNFEPVHFTPVDVPHVAHHPKYRNRPCEGVFLRVTSREVFEPVRTGLHLLWAIRTTYPSDFAWRPEAMDRLAGTDVLRRDLEKGVDPEEMVARWEADVEQFNRIRQAYMLYA